MRTIEPELRLAIDAKNLIGETPIWHPEERALYWIDCHGHEVLRWDAETAEVRRWPVPERIGGLVFRTDGSALVVLASGIYDIDFATGALSFRIASPLPAHVSMHESGCDPTGRMWVGGINNDLAPGNFFPGGAGLFRLNGETLVREVDDISCANGLAFAPDGRTLYFTDAATARCDRYPLDPTTGALGLRETFFQLGEGEGFIDGATVDAEGGYWATLVSVGKLRRYLPDGTPDIEVLLPFNNPTKVVFGGDDYRTLFVTSMSETLGGTNPTPLDGGVFAFEPGVAGLPEPRLTV
jgi:L-arabinonolactonase